MNEAIKWSQQSHAVTFSLLCMDVRVLCIVHTYKEAIKQIKHAPFFGAHLFFRYYFTYLQVSKYVSQLVSNG